MSYATLKVESADRITTITLNCPDRRNALDDVMMKDLLEALLSVNRSAECRAVILTGAGSAFCAGMDLDYLKRYSELGHGENLDDARQFMKLLQTINSLKKPVIAMVNGAAMGGGCGVAAACDMVFAGKEMGRFGAPEVRLGFLPALILIFLIKRMGEGKAREFVLRGGIAGSAEAKELGLVTEIVDDDALHSRVNEFARELAASTSPSSISLTKDLFARLGDFTEKEALEYAANLNALTRKTDDFKKGIASFINKEKLRW
jgi:methylglutaconyl-CoA hydratase